MVAVSVELDGYVDFDEVGRGGFGVVYRAREVALGRDVAIKFLPAAAMGESTRKRFERECRAMAVLSSHPNIVSLIAHGVAEESRRPYIVMEYVSGGSLGRTELPWQKAVEVGVALAGALETAHRATILHRDVKPENILISRYGEAKLADFGVAKVQDSSETPTGNITASILHAAPETLIGQRPSPGTDVYSLASTLYALILGRAPFARTDEETLAPLITRICIEPAPGLMGRAVPPRVEAVLKRGLHKEPRERFGSAIAFAEALQQAQAAEGLPVTACHVHGEVLDPVGRELPADRPSEGLDALTAPRPALVAAGGAAGDVTMPRPRPAVDPAVASAQTKPTGTRRVKAPVLAGLAVVLAAVLAGGTAVALSSSDSPAPGVAAVTPTALATGSTSARTGPGQPSAIPSAAAEAARVSAGSGGTSTGSTDTSTTAGSAGGGGGGTGSPAVAGAVGSTVTGPVAQVGGLPGAARTTRSSSGTAGSAPVVPRPSQTTSAPKPSGVQLPNFYGWSRDSARAWLQSHGLVYPGEYPTTDHSALREFAVVRQSVAPGTYVQKGRSVLLTSKDNDYCAAHPSEAAC